MTKREIEELKKKADQLREIFTGMEHKTHYEILEFILDYLVKVLTEQKKEMEKHGRIIENCVQ